MKDKHQHTNYNNSIFFSRISKLHFFYFLTEKMFNNDDNSNYNVSHSEIDNNSRCYSADDEEDLFQIDDLPTNNNLPPQNNNTKIDMQVRYYKPTNEPPHGLSQSVVTNDTDYLRKNIMNMRTKSMMAINNQLSPSHLEALFELEETNNNNNSC